MSYTHGHATHMHERFAAGHSKRGLPLGRHASAKGNYGLNSVGTSGLPLGTIRAGCRSGDTRAHERSAAGHHTSGLPLGRHANAKDNYGLKRVRTSGLPLGTIRADRHCEPLTTRPHDTHTQMITCYDHTTRTSTMQTICIASLDQQLEQLVPLCTDATRRVREHKRSNGVTRTIALDVNAIVNPVS